MEFFTEYAGFLLKLLTVAIIFGLFIAGVASGKSKPKEGGISIRNMNDQYEKRKDILHSELLDKKELKKLAKEKKKRAKEKSAKSEEVVERRKVFVLNFDGDIKASAVDAMREEITAILSVATEKDEVVVRLESGGGMVHSYGLASSQLLRIKEANVRLTVCVDKVAASGGYMMACVADKIIAAPFAVLGSIGVVAQVPNIHRLLDKNLVDVELHTAGKYKRTLTMLGENTDEGREKFRQDLEDTHVLFKEFVSSQRDVVDIESIATGDVWYGTKALDNKLIDELSTSDGYLVNRYNDSDVFSVSYKEPKKMAERLGLSVLSAVETKFTKWFSSASQHRGY
ncbi:protease SohB [Marinomonas algicola]|uniref:protease SohB n=1 Tax=Marinomonas algicola TaxID=2773454 RepID=UPI00174AF23E|nr:protease SohB [Marinomonas algicola]